MIKEKGLTGIREDARGFVGSRPAPKVDSTLNGRSRIAFCIACGKNNEKAGKFPTWRYCVGYDQVAKDLSKLKVGDLVKVNGWMITEWQTDEYYKPVLDDKGKIRTREILVLYKAEIYQREKQPALQPALISEYS